MKTYSKEDLDPIIKDLVEIIAAKYPGLPMVLIVSDTAKKNFARAQSGYLSSPYEVIRLCLEQIAHINDQSLAQQNFMVQMAQNQDVAIAMIECANQVKN